MFLHFKYNITEAKKYCISDFLKTKKQKMLKQSQRKAICFGKHEVGWGRGGVKFPISSQLALKTPNGTCAYKRCVCSKITGGRCPIPKFGAEAANGSREQREAGAGPGIASCLRHRMYRQRYRQKEGISRRSQRHSSHLH